VGTSEPLSLLRAEQGRKSGSCWITLTQGPGCLRFNLVIADEGQIFKDKSLTSPEEASRNSVDHLWVRRTMATPYPTEISGGQNFGEGHSLKNCRSVLLMFISLLFFFTRDGYADYVHIRNGLRRHADLFLRFLVGDPHEFAPPEDKRLCIDLRIIHRHGHL
jgi:hypothetical protein